MMLKQQFVILFIIVDGLFLHFRYFHPQYYSIRSLRHLNIRLHFDVVVPASRKIILELADQRGSENEFYPAEVARLIDPENWKKKIEQVELVAETHSRRTNHFSEIEKKDRQGLC